MFTTTFSDDPFIAGLRAMMIESRFTEVVRRTDDLGPEPGTAVERARWREVMCLRSISFVVLVRYADAETCCRRVLRSADADGDRAARVHVLGYGLAAAWFLGEEDESVDRLDEVLAAAEAMPAGAERMSTFVAAAVAAGMIGLTELSDRLIAQVVAQVAAAPAGSIRAGTVLFLHSLMTTRRCQLAITLEQAEPAKAAALYRSVLDQAGRVSADINKEAMAGGELPERPAALYLSHLCFAKIAVGEPAGIEASVKAVQVTGVTEPFDAVSATSEIMWGLCELRLALRNSSIGPEELSRLETLAKQLMTLARRTRTLVLQAETSRMYLAVVGLGDDPLLRASAEERYEAALDDLDWTARLEHAQFTGFRSQTMKDIGARILNGA